MADDLDWFALFLALGETRLDESRAALGIDAAGTTAIAVDEVRARAALVPLAVDAALLGAEGVSALALALADHAKEAPRRAIADAVARLSGAVAALGHTDASGARTDEAALMGAAKELRALAPTDAKDAAQAHDAASPPHASDEVNWIPSLPEELVGPFLDECQERIEGLSARILRVEQEGPGADSGEEMRALFRDLHTLKGSSGFAGLVRLNRLAHAAEDLIGKVRDGKAPCDRPVIDVLLASLDRFRAIVERASVRAPIDVEVDDVIERLRHPSAYAPKTAEAIERTNASSTAAASAPTAGHAAAPFVASSGTLRVEFERVDQLQNFVNELVLARSRLTRATSKLGVSRELSRMRRRVHGLSRAGTGGVALDRELTSIADELGRTERVVDEGEVELEGSIGALALALGQLRDRVMKLRMIPIARLFAKHQRTVRELGQQLGKKVRLELVGEGTELDKVLVEQLEDPLIHLVRNAVDHGIETPDRRLAAGKPEIGTLTLRARQQGGAIVIEVADDGAGIDVERMRAKAVEKGVATADEVAAMTDREALELVFRPGFSTAEKVTDVSGRGVGMDVVRESIARLKGTIAIHSVVSSAGDRRASGTTFELRLPLTLAIAQVLLARVAGEEVAVPLDAVAHTLAVGVDEMGNEGGGTMDEVGGRPCYVRRDQDGHSVHIPVVDLAATLGLEDLGPGPGATEKRTREVGGGGHQGGHLILLDAPMTGVPHVALSCDALLGRHEVVVKPLGPLLTTAPCVAGASLMGNRVVLLLDVGAVVRRGLETTTKKRPSDRGQPATAPRRAEKKRARVLVAEDADVVREGLRIALENVGLEVVVARDGEEALEQAKNGSFDLVSTDVMMPRLDGYGLTRALRALPAYHKTPIVMVTSRDQRVDVLRGYDAGVDAYVTKPADVNALLKTIEELLARRG